MFSEPQSLTVNAVAKSLPRVAYGDRAGIFQSEADGITLRVSHDLRNRNRRQVRADFTKTAADPLLDGVSRQYSMSVFLVIDHPKVGFSVAEVGYNAQALIDWLDTPANLAKVTGGES